MVWVLLLVLVVLLALVWFVARVGKYRRSVPYSPKSDYFYGFDEEVVVEGSSDGRVLRVPRIDVGVATLLAEVQVVGAAFVDHKLVLKSGELRVSCAFERGAGGRRYLDLTSFLPALRREPLDIRVEGQGISVASGAVKLFGFKSPLEGKRLMIIAPHPDDAEIAAFGLYSSHAESSCIVTITSGDDSLRYRSVAAGPGEASYLSAQIRVYDSLVCGTWGGVPPSRSVSLGYFDGKLTEMRKRAPAVVAARHMALESPAEVRGSGSSTSTWASLVADLREQIIAHKPDVVVTAHPVLDSHPDHVAATLAVCEAILSVPAANPRLFLYVNHHRLTEAYPFGSLGDSVPLPPALEDAHGCRRVYSHPLDFEMRRRKMFALDNMHALRDVPEPMRKGVLRREVVNWLRRVFLGSHRYDFNYYRRAVRANEVFFVVEPLEVRGFYESVSGGVGD